MIPSTPTSAAVRILELAQGFCVSKVLMAAVELGVFSQLASCGPLSEPDLRIIVGIQERGAKDFLDALVALGFLYRDAEGRYVNAAETARHLDPRRNGYVGSWVEMAGSRQYAPWGQLAEALRTGQPQSDVAGSLGSDDHYRLLYADLERRRQFLNAMSGSALIPSQEIAHRFEWQNYKTVADIGCAEGSFLSEVVRVNPGLFAIGFDLIEVADAFQATISLIGLSDRVRFQAGDFRTEDLPEADVIVMGRVLHNWDLPMKKMLIAKAYKSLTPGGTLLIYDRMIDESRSKNLYALLASLNMLVMTKHGFDYTVVDCVNWMREAGFCDLRTEQLSDSHSFATGRK